MAGFASTQQRDRAIQLARSRPEAALDLARRIEEPWFRSQALAAVVRTIDEARVDSVVRAAVSAAEAGKDDYQRSAVLAWTIAALIARGRTADARRILERARQTARAVAPTGSRAEALSLLCEAAWPLGASVRLALLNELVDLLGVRVHWRGTRAVVHGLGHLARDAPEEARALASRISDPKSRRKALAAIDEPPAHGPRSHW